MTKIKDLYWIEKDSFVHSSIPNESETSHGIEGSPFQYVHTPHIQNPHNRSLSRLEVSPHAQTFCSKPELLYTTKYSDLFVTYTKSSNMHEGQPSPHFVFKEYISGQLVFDPNKTTNVFQHSIFRMMLLQSITIHILIQKQVIPLSGFPLYDSTRTKYSSYCMWTWTESISYNLCNVKTKPSTCWIPFNRK